MLVLKLGVKHLLLVYADDVNTDNNSDRHTRVLNVLGQLAPHWGIKKNLIQGGSNMTGTDLYVNKPHCAAALRP